MTTTPFLQGAADLLDIRPDETRLVTLVFLFGLLLNMSATLAHAATFSLFLARFGAGQLPVVYIGLGLVSAAVTTLYLRAGARLPLARTLSGAVVLLIACFAALWIILSVSETPAALFCLPIVWGVANVLTLTMLWNLAGRLFDLRQGKRLFGLLSASDPIGAVAIGLATPTLVGLFGSVNLIAASALPLAAALVVLGRILAIARAPLAIPAEEPAAAGAASPGGGIDRYVGLIFLVFTLYIIGIYFVDNIFYAQVEAVMGDADTMTAFVARFFAAAGAISLLIQIFLSGRLIRRMGVASMLLATPVTLGLGTLAFAFSGVFSGGAPAALFWLAVTTNLARVVLDAVDTAAINVLYQPLPALERTRAQTIVDGILYPLGVALAGVLLMVLRNGLGFGTEAAAWALLAILAAWLAAAVLLGRAYRARLAGALATARPGASAMAPAGDAAALPDPRTAALAEFAPGGPRLTESELAAGVEGEAAEIAWLLAGEADLGEAPDLAMLRQALAAEIDRRRTHILHLLAMRHDQRAVRALEAGLRSPHADQRAYAVEMLDMILPPALKRVLMPVFDDMPARTRLRRLGSAFPQKRLCEDGRLREIIRAPAPLLTSWTRACALRVAGERRPPREAPVDPRAQEVAVRAPERRTAPAAGRFRGRRAVG